MALRVLLADNSESIKKVILISLQEHGVDLKVVSSGLDVIDVATKFNPEIIFVDILLQKQSGYEVARLIKTHPVLKTTPVVLMWSGFMDLDEDKARDALADARLEKPFEADALRGLVKKLVDSKAAAPTKKPSMTLNAQNLSAHLDLPDTPVPGPINIRDHLDAPDAAPLPEVDLHSHIDEFQQVEIGSLPEFAGQAPVSNFKQEQAEHSPFELGLPEGSSADDVPVEFNEPEAVKNMDFLLNRDENPNFAIEPATTITKVGTEFVVKGSSGTNLTHVQLEEIVKQQCQEIIEKMAWKLVPDLASKIVKEELNRLIRDLEK